LELTNVLPKVYPASLFGEVLQHGDFSVLQEETVLFAPEIPFFRDDSRNFLK
jgi:hypothetical protein